MDTRLRFVLERHQQVERGELSVERAYAMLLNNYRSLVSECEALEQKLREKRSAKPEAGTVVPKIECEYCHRYFTPKSVDNGYGAKYCPDRFCRQSAYYQRQKEAKRLARLEALEARQALQSS